MKDKQMKKALTLISDALREMAEGIEDESQPEPVQASPSNPPSPVLEITETLPPLAEPVSYQNNPNMPGYDPEPPFIVHAVPPRSEQFNKDEVLVKKDMIIVCTKCRTAVLKANRDIDGSDIPGKGLSMTAYDCIVAGIEIPERLTLYNEPTGKTIDCIVCRASRGLWLVGAPPPVIDTSTKPMQEGARSF